MYWWNVTKLAEDFREDRVDEKERFKYLLATIICWTAVVDVGSYYGRSLKLLDLMFPAMGIVGVIVGITLCYRANKNGDNKDFIGRMICLSWPIGIELSVLFIVIAMPFLFFTSVTAVAHEVSSDLVGAISGFIVGILFLIFYYWKRYKYVNIVAQSHMVKDLD